MLNIDLLEGLIRSNNIFLNSDMVVHERSETSCRFHSLNTILKIGVREPHCPFNLWIIWIRHSHIVS